MIPQVGLRVRIGYGSNGERTVATGTIDEVVKVYDPKLAGQGYVYRFVVATGRPYPNHRLSFFGDTYFEVLP